MRSHFAPRGLPLNKIGKRLQGKCCIPNLKHQTGVVLKKKIFVYLSIYFYGLNLGPAGAGHLGP